MQLLVPSFLLAAAAVYAQPFDLLLKGGRVIDPKNNINRTMDVAVSGGKIARVAENIPPAGAAKVVDAAGLYVTPGLVDIHVHVYAGTGLRGLTGDQSVYPDGFSFRAGVTTMVDAGTAGWRNFEDFNDRVISRAKTRVLAFLNIGGVGMAPKGENDPADMDPAEAIKTAKAYPGLIVGIKVAHFSRGGWLDIDNALKAGNATGLPIMVDFGRTTQERTLRTLLLDKLRPGDIYTHCYSGLRTELVEGHVNPAMEAARKRGVIFDLGHGAGSFFWRIAVPAFQDKFYPDSISTDLHTSSMNAGMKDMTETMSKVLNLGVPLEEVIRQSTWNPAREIKHPELGNLDVGSEADITLLTVEKGRFGLIDSAGLRMDGTQRILPEMTIRRGTVVWDRNGRASAPWR